MKVYSYFLLFVYSILSQSFLEKIDSSYTKKIINVTINEIIDKDTIKVIEYEEDFFSHYKIEFSKSKNSYDRKSIIFVSINKRVRRITLAGTYEANFDIIAYDDKKRKIWSKKILNDGQELEFRDDFILLKEYISGDQPYIVTPINYFTGSSPFEKSSKLAVITKNNFNYYIGIIKNDRYGKDSATKNFVYRGKLILATANNIIEEFHIRQNTLLNDKMYYFLLLNSINDTIKFNTEEYNAEALFQVNFANRSLQTTSQNGISFEKINLKPNYLNNGTFKNIENVKNKKKLRILRNEIFARHNYSFKSKDLNSYFKAKHWYKPIPFKKVRAEDFTQSEYLVYQLILRQER